MAEGAEHRDVRIAEAAPLFFKNYANFEGRSSRGAYWWWLLIALLAYAGLWSIDATLLGAQRTGIYVMAALFAVATLLPQVAISVRRLHDIDLSAWWLLFVLVPVGGALLLLVLFALPGKRVENRFGADIEAGR
jgi:uncharacterized membrane protein YhaH (DUF805 family)